MDGNDKGDNECEVAPVRPRYKLHTASMILLKSIQPRNIQSCN